jgi:hypothetical protein
MAIEKRRKDEQREYPLAGKRTRAGGEGRTPAYALTPSHHALTVNTENADPSLVPCLVTVDTGAYVTVARPDNADGWP